MVLPIKNIQWLDTLRALATLGVIIIHVSTPTVKMIYGKNMEYWWIGNFIDSSVRFAVPLFLMLSGATMLAKEYKLGEFYKKRITRVFFPFIFWMITYLIYRWIILTPIHQPTTFSTMLHWGTDLFLKEGISKHFWYIYMILFIYLFIPFIGIGLRKLNNSTILYILAGWLILTFICKSVPLNLYCWSEEYWSKLLGYFLYTGFLILGYYLSKLVIKIHKIRCYSIILFILSILISAVSTFIFSEVAHKLDLRVYSYLTVNSIIQAIAIFLWMKDSNIRNKYILMLQRAISNYSYGIYLVHILVIGIFFNNGIFWTMAYPLISLPLVSLMTLVTSFIIIYILRKIPFGIYISG